jgi:hypothetical protein
VLHHEIECHNGHIFNTGQLFACGDVQLLPIVFGFVQRLFGIWIPCWIQR